MDRAEAIKVIGLMKRQLDIDTTIYDGFLFEALAQIVEKQQEALSLAIEALEKLQLSEETSTNSNKNSKDNLSFSKKGNDEGVAESATTTDCSWRREAIEALCAKCTWEGYCGGGCPEVAIIEGMPSCNQKQVTSKLESEQMREYIPKGEVLDIIKSMPMDLVEEYVYELDGIWIDDKEEVDYCNNCPYISWSEGCVICRQQVVEAIEGVDWYHVNSKGELVHGSTSDEESWYKAEDIYKAIESLPPVTPTEHKVTETMIVDGMEMEIDPVSYEIGYSHGQVAPAEKTGEWVSLFDGNEWFIHCSKCKTQHYEEDLLMGGSGHASMRRQASVLHQKKNMGVGSSFSYRVHML